MAYLCLLEPMNGEKSERASQQRVQPSIALLQAGGIGKEKGHNLSGGPSGSNDNEQGERELHHTLLMG